MPTYEYKCNNCGKIFEVFQKITDEPLTTCPECNGKLTRLISGGIGIIFKGSGFYTTDYKNSSVLNKSKDNKAKDVVSSSNNKNVSKKDTTKDTTGEKTSKK